MKLLWLIIKRNILKLLIRRSRIIKSIVDKSLEIKEEDEDEETLIIKEILKYVQFILDLLIEIILLSNLHLYSKY